MKGRPSSHMEPHTHERTQRRACWRQGTGGRAEQAPPPKSQAGPPKTQTQGGCRQEAKRTKDLGTYTNPAPTKFKGF